MGRKSLDDPKTPDHSNTPDYSMAPESPGKFKATARVPGKWVSRRVREQQERSQPQNPSDQDKDSTSKPEDPSNNTNNPPSTPPPRDPSRTRTTHTPAWGPSPPESSRPKQHWEFTRHTTYVKRGRVEPYFRFKVGVLFSAPHHHADYANNDNDPNGPPRDWRDLTCLGTWTYTKMRKFIVVRTYEEHCQVIPIFTFNGKGLGKGEGKWGKKSPKEYVAVRDEKWDESLRVEGVNGYVKVKREEWYEGKEVGGWACVSDKAYAHFTAVVSFEYNWPVEIQGRIVGTDLEKLEGLFLGQFCGGEGEEEEEGGGGGDDGDDWDGGGDGKGNGKERGGGSTQGSDTVRSSRSRKGTLPSRAEGMLDYKLESLVE